MRAAGAGPRALGACLHPESPSGCAAQQVVGARGEEGALPTPHVPGQNSKRSESSEFDPDLPGH